MAELASTDVTVSLDARDREPFGLRNIMTFPSIAFGDGALTYPAGGVPMPAIGNFGMKKAVTRMHIEQPANGNSYHYDKTNNKIRIFTATATEATGAVAAITLYATVIGQ
jgi:hypothetical protein